MKKLVLLSIVILLMGCQPAFYSREVSPKVDVLSQVNVGSEIYSLFVGTSNSSGFKYGDYEELIYTGTSQNVVYILYREYYNGIGQSSILLKPAFSHEYRYDISTQKTITFRNLQFEILSADGDKIVYKLLKAPSNFKTEVVNDYTSSGPAKRLKITMVGGKELIGNVIEQEKGKFVKIKTEKGDIVEVKWLDMAHYEWIE